MLIKLFTSTTSVERRGVFSVMLQQSVSTSNYLTVLGFRIREHKAVKEKKIITPDLLNVNGQCFFFTLAPRVISGR